ncbi:hypothetical protein [Nocardia sp. BMG111209]|uniref:hypothetical protein n=1 Tax=Nocardia sp. BMG111209 TaxID=1160137 RepID=UPI00037AE495|nr:hypothetical protein [Nocardia sp. BMG111209]
MRFIALAPALLVCAGMSATILAAAVDHAAYHTMTCGGTRSMPVQAAVLLSLALAAAILALTLVFRPGEGRFRAGPNALHTWTTIVTFAATVIPGCFWGPRDQHGIDPTAGPLWAVWSIAALLTVVTARGCRSILRTRGSKEGPSWIVVGIGVLATAAVLGKIVDSCWLDPEVLQKICWAG